MFVHAQAALGIPRGTIRATVLIETILAAFEMDEILYELREHAAGLNAGRWDYLFSAIKKFRTDPQMSTPDRAQLTMTVPFMRAYTELLVQTCHRRGAHAIGGMAAFIPNRRDPEVTERAMARVRDDKERESSDGFDGTWVAHPDLVPLATRGLRRRPRRPAEPEGPDPRRGGRRGRAAARPAGRGRRGHRGRRPGRTSGSPSPIWTRGCAASARPPSTTSWRTRRRPRSPARSSGCGSPGPSRSTTARAFDAERYAAIRDEELARLGGAGEGRLAEAVDLLDRLVLDDEFADFLTLRAYAILE